MTKGSKTKTKVEAVPDPDSLNPQSDVEFFERGWLYYSHQKYEQAEADFRLILQKDGANVDAWYALGLALKALGSSQQAVDAFTQIDRFINQVEDRQRATIISRLSHGQINQIRTGSWNLEKEIWKSKY
jgi:tetratricopeptide (TPR) repeat protein